ncbi:MAG: hypothetical protein AAB701_00580 [Patescibacteria group bacterium]
MHKWLKPIGIGAIVALLCAVVRPVPAQAALFTLESMALSNPALNQTGVTYTMTVSSQTAATIRCITLRLTDTLGSNSLPAGMDISGATLSGTSTIVPTPGAWTPVGVNATGVITILNAAGELPAGGAGRTLVLGGIENGSTGNTSYYAELTTFSDVACTTAVDTEGIALFVFTSGVLITSIVVDALSFSIDPSCSTGGLNPESAGKCTLQMHASTNHATGYTISYSATNTLTHSQNADSVTPIGSTAQASQPGTKQFGFNMVANTNPSVGAGPAGGSGVVSSPYDTPNMFAFTTSGGPIATTATFSADTLYTISYIANTSPNMVSGNYVSSQTFTIVANP